MVTRIRTACRRGARHAGAALLAAGAVVAFAAALDAGPAAGAGRAGTGSGAVWLCRPGTAGDPCAYDPTVTSVTSDGATSVSTPATSPTAHAFDCFYVYPTVSQEQGDNADLAVQQAEIDAAVVQASQFSRVCNVWAPMYRQATSVALVDGAFLHPSVISTAYASLLSAWKDYLAHDNHGRPIVFIGHSQGAAMLIKLLRAQVDPSAILRKRMVSALILGGNVQVTAGSARGGSFRNIPTCGSATQTGCVIAYSTFGSPPPSDSFFGRPGQGVGLQSGQTATGGQQVACVNPVTFSSQPAGLQPYFLSATSKVRHLDVTTPWVTYPGLYTAQCERSGGASWLQVTATAAAGDPRPEVTATQGPLWGYHVDDVNLALGNLVADVGSEEGAYH